MKRRPPPVQADGPRARLIAREQASLARYGAMWRPRGLLERLLRGEPVEVAAWEVGLREDPHARVRVESDDTLTPMAARPRTPAARRRVR